MKRINKSALVITLFVGFLLAGPLGSLGAFCINMIPRLSTGVIQSGLFPEIWTGEMVKKLRADDAATFLNEIPDYSQYAENDVIHLVDVGADPDVLINNTTYPIPIQDLPDSDIAISLDKYQTKATRITDDELHSIKHDKMGSVVERHKLKITGNKYRKAAHALAPQSNSTLTPVIATTGATDSHRKRITKEDIISLKAMFDKMDEETQVPDDGNRILVLCSDHVNDLLLFDQKFADQYYNYQSGKIANLYSFKVYTYSNCPYFDGETLAKKAFGAVKGAKDFQASFAFYGPRMFKATGSTNTYMSEAKNNPTTQENLINFRHYFITLPKKQEAIGAIVSTYVA